MTLLAGRGGDHGGRWERGRAEARRRGGRSLHPPTFRLNVSTFRGIGYAFKGFQEVFRRHQGVLGGAQGVFCVRNGSG